MIDEIPTYQVREELVISRGAREATRMVLSAENPARAHERIENSLAMLSSAQQTQKSDIQINVPAMVMKTKLWW